MPDNVFPSERRLISELRPARDFLDANPQFVFDLNDGVFDPHKFLHAILPDPSCDFAQTCLISNKVFRTWITNKLFRELLSPGHKHTDILSGYIGTLMSVPLWTDAYWYPTQQFVGNEYVLIKSSKPGTYAGLRTNFKD